MKMMMIVGTMLVVEVITMAKMCQVKNLQQVLKQCPMQSAEFAAIMEILKILQQKPNAVRYGKSK